MPPVVPALYSYCTYTSRLLPGILLRSINNTALPVYTTRILAPKLIRIIFVSYVRSGTRTYVRTWRETLAYCTPVYVCCLALTFFLPNDISSTPRVRPDYSSYSYRDVVVFTLNRCFYPTTSAVPPVSVLILHPRGIPYKLWVTDCETEKPDVTCYIAHKTENAVRTITSNIIETRIWSKSAPQNPFGSVNTLRSFTAAALPTEASK